MRVRGRSLKMSADRGISSDLIILTRKMSIYKKNKENLSNEKMQEPPCAGSELTFFKTEIKKSEGLENILSPSPAPAA